MRRITRIPQLLETHADELAFVLRQWRVALMSEERTARDITALRERIEAHLQGLLIASPAELVARFDAARPGGDRDDAAAAALAVLRTGDESAVGALLSAIAATSGPALEGMRDAIGLAPSDATRVAMGALLSHSQPPVAAASAVALANTNQLMSDAPGLPQLLTDPDPQVCSSAWLAAGRADFIARASGRFSDRDRPHREALARPEPEVRDAVWCYRVWVGDVLAYPELRVAVEAGDEIALCWLSVIGTVDDRARIGAAAMALGSPTSRCRVLARYGDPGILPVLLRWIEGDDAEAARAAGWAFSRLTGVDIRGVRQPLPPRRKSPGIGAEPGPDLNDSDIAPLVWLPDAARARRALDRHGLDWSGARRLCQGSRVDPGQGPVELRPLDMQTRWDVGARASLQGAPVCAPPPIV